MSQTPEHLKYTETHEWVRTEEDGVLTIGITDHAQALLGDLVYVELPDVDTEMSAGEEAGVVESVKAASDIYSPVSGTIVAINEKLLNSPELVNSDPYGEGWLFQVQLDDESELDELLNAEKYAEQVAATEH
jgi:glycine cleavage system H protein